MGIAYGKLEQYEEALAGYKKATDLKPDYALAYRDMGKAYSDLGQDDDAIAAYKMFIAVQPTGEEADSVRERISELSKK